jgi:ABC-type lipopolysaccharide export system ATPase subunit
MTKAMEADGIQLSFGERKILSDIYIKVEKGAITGLLGRNGSGKSCLMKVIYGTQQAERSVRIDKKRLPLAYIQPKLLQYLPQFNFIPTSLKLKRIFSDFEIDYHEFQKRFPEFAGRHSLTVSSLSGGEERLIEVYIILKSAAEFVMLDEPFTHLNPLQIEKVKELIKDQKNRKGILVTDHMYLHVLELAQKIYVLVNGKTHVMKNTEHLQDLGYVRS